MRSLVKITIVVATVGVFLLSGLPGEAQEATPNPQVPELKPLDHFVGSWECNLVKFDESGPEDTKTKGDITTHWILRGRVIQQELVWSPGDIHGLGLLTYDAEKKAYRQWYFDSNGTLPQGDLRGEWNEDAKTLTWTGRSANAIMSTVVHRFIEDDTIEWSLVDKDRVGKVVLHLESKAKRKPSVTISDTQGRGAKAPPPEMKLLQQFVGTWREANVSKVAEWTPKETRGKSTLKASPILGGHFIRCEVYDDDGNPLAVMFRTFDAEQQAYRQWMFRPGSCGVESRGQWDEATNTLTLTDEGQKITSVATIWFSDKDTMQWSFISRDGQGKVYFNAVGKSVRQR